MLPGVVRDVGLSGWENTTEAASVDEKPLEGSIVEESNCESNLSDERVPLGGAHRPERL